MVRADEATRFKPVQSGNPNGWRCLASKYRIRSLIPGLDVGRVKFNVFSVRTEKLIEGRPELVAIVGPLLKACECYRAANR